MNEKEKEVKWSFVPNVDVPLQRRTDDFQYLLLLLAESVPHGGNDLGHLSKGGVGVLALDGSLGVSEEQGVSRNRLLGLVRILLLLLLWSLGLLGRVHRRRSLLTNHLHRLRQIRRGNVLVQSSWHRVKDTRAKV